MKKEIIIVTGGIGSGKSTIVDFMVKNSEVAVDVFNFDKFNAEIFENAHFVEDLNRTFGVKTKLELFELIKDLRKKEDPDVEQRVSSIIDRVSEMSSKLVLDKFIEVVTSKINRTLIIEFPFAEMMKKYYNEIALHRQKFKVIVVKCDRQHQVTRVINDDKRTLASKSIIQNILARQCTNEERERVADYIILSDVSKPELENKVKALIQQKFKKVLLKHAENI
jgi:dephospho-CoA kinase